MVQNRRLFIAATVAAISASGPAWAHARLVSASPARDAVGSSPAAIRLTFSERLVAAFSSFEVINAAGVALPVRVVVSEDGLTLTGAPSRRLAAGVYSVNWAIASTDGHRMTGSYRFTVR
jgi:methionine-rich copper-binding protein CopC